METMATMLVILVLHAVENAQRENVRLIESNYL
jgi:hypothetical protein